MSSSKSAVKRRPKTKSESAEDVARALKGGEPVALGFFEPDAETLRYWRARSEFIRRGPARSSRGREA